MPAVYIARLITFCKRYEHGETQSIHNCTFYTEQRGGKTTHHLLEQTVVSESHDLIYYIGTQFIKMSGWPDPYNYFIILTLTGTLKNFVSNLSDTLGSSFK